MICEADRFCGRAKKGGRRARGRWIAVATLLWAAAAAWADTACRAGGDPLYLSCDSALDSEVFAGFRDSLFASLERPIGEIGYCLRRFDEQTADTSALLLHVSYHGSHAAGQPGAVHAALLEVSRFSRLGIREALKHPLVVLDYAPDDPVTFLRVLVRKIVENMRTSYVCHLVVESDPAGVHLRTDRGLEGTAPVEWILPLGEVTLSARRENYLPVDKTLDLSTPGNHRVYLQLGRRRFYHSRWMYGVVGAGLGSAVSYGLCRYYYGQYRALGAEERAATPERFGETFTRAKNLERMSAGLLGVAGLCLSLSFWF